MVGTAAEVIRAGGVQGLWLGTGPSVIRVGAGAGLHFVLLEQLKHLMLTLQPRAASEDGRPPRLSAPEAALAGGAPRGPPEVVLEVDVLVRSTMRWFAIQRRPLKGGRRRADVPHHGGQDAHGVRQDWPRAGRLLIRRSSSGGGRSSGGRWETAARRAGLPQHGARAVQHRADRGRGGPVPGPRPHGAHQRALLWCCLPPGCLLAVQQPLLTPDQRLSWQSRDID